MSWPPTWTSTSDPAGEHTVLTWPYRRLILARIEEGPDKEYLGVVPHIIQLLNDFEVYIEKYLLNNWAHPSNHVICFKYLLQICTKMNGFKFDFSRNFWGGAPSPFPKPLPPFSHGFCHQFGLRFQFMGASHPILWLRPRLSGAPQPRFGLHPQFSISEIGLTPKIYSWIRQCWSSYDPFGEFFDRLLIINYTDWLRYGV